MQKQVPHNTATAALVGTTDDTAIDAAIDRANERRETETQDDAFADLARQNSVRALENLIDIMKNPEAKPEHVMRASETVIAYGFGKPGHSAGDKNGDSDIRIEVHYD